MSKPRNNLIGHTIFLTSEKYHMRPVIGNTMFFTSEKSDIGFPAFRRGFPKWECSQLSLLPLTRSWFLGLQRLFQSNNLSKTQQNVALLKEFLTLKNESRLMEEIPPKELNAYISEFIMITVRKKDNNEDYEPSSLRSLMARRIQHFCQKPLVNKSPTFTSPETEMKSTTRYIRLNVLDSDSE